MNGAFGRAICSVAISSGKNKTWATLLITIAVLLLKLLEVVDEETANNLLVMCGIGVTASMYSSIRSLMKILHELCHLIEGVQAQERPVQETPKILRDSHAAKEGGAKPHECSEEADGEASGGCRKLM